MHVPFVDLKKQTVGIRAEVDVAIAEVVSDAAFVLGPAVEAFEAEFARYCGVAHAVGVSSGTAALHLALLAVGVGPGDEVITVPNTFVATVEAILYTGATPKFVDVEPKTYNMDPEKLADGITAKTKAVIPVHLYGQMADMAAILNVTGGRQISVIEDACQAHGGSCRLAGTGDWTKAGSIGDAGCFSFYPPKNLGAFGEAGIVVTKHDDLAVTVRALRHHGQYGKNVHARLGYNYRMDGIQGAVLSVKLKHLDRWNSQRKKNAAAYESVLRYLDVIYPGEALHAQHVYHLYVIRPLGRKSLNTYLGSKGVATGIHYPIPIHLQDGYRFLGYKAGDFPVAEKCCKEVLSLPMYPELSSEQIEYVTNQISVWSSGADHDRH